MSKKYTPTGRQIAAARVLAGISQADLAEAARSSIPTLRRMEASTGEASGMANNVRAVVEAIERAGVDFLPAGEAGPGVRLREL